MAFSPADRRAGVLLHFTSLPGPEGVGSLGNDAREFVDFLNAAGMSEWQVLPANPPGPGHSPYAARSSFAGNPMLVSIASLAAEGFLAEREARPPAFPIGRVAFAEVAAWKERMLRVAFANRPAGQREEQAAFEADAAWWLDDWTLFAALDSAHAGGWQEWPDGLARREPLAMARARHELAAEIDYHAFAQWCFERQFRSLRQYAESARVAFFGDMPIFPALHSADVWAHQGSFKLDERGVPPVIAGVPPDLFSATGQRWGNPLYDWAAEGEGGYSYWVARLRRAFELFDRLRIDHFRGFEAAWEIPAAEPTAMHGRWVSGPGLAFFDAIRGALGPLPIVVEDLGVITDDVKAVRDSLGFPGMLVLQFAFDGGEDNPYLPQNHVANAVVYTGTHDNDTTAGWWAGLDVETRERARSVVGRSFSEPANDLAEVAFASPANLAVVPMQDVLGLGSEARMNTPGTAEGNWAWRFAWDRVSGGLADEWRERVGKSGR